MRIFKYQKGYLMIEMLISIFFLTVVVISIVTTLNFLIRRQNLTKYDSQASLVLQEGIEIAYYVLMSDWEDYLPGEYYPSLDTDGHRWVLLEGTEPPLEGRFTRTLEIREVCRDTDGGRTDPPCNSDHLADDYSREVEVTVAWNEGKISGKLLVIEQLAYH